MSGAGILIGLVLAATPAPPDHDGAARAAMAWAATGAVAAAGDPNVTVNRETAGQTERCRGTVVGKRMVLTVKHLTESGAEAGRYEVRVGGKTVAARLSRVAFAEDLALLETDADLGVDPPAWGDPVPGAGVSMDGLFEPGKRGTVRPGGVTYMETTVRAVRGDSGAGLFDADRRLVGVAWGMRFAEGVQAATPGRLAKRFVEDAGHQSFPDYNSAADEARRTDKPVLVMFTRQECVLCQLLKAGMVGEDLSGAVKAVVNTDQDPKATAAFGVTSLPTVCVGRVGKAGGVTRLVGAQATKEAILRAIK